MPHKITKLEPSGIIQIVYIGEVSLDERMNLITELALNYIESDPPKIIIDARSLLTSMTKIEQEIWGQFIGSCVELKSAFVALIYKPDVEINRSAIASAQKLGHKVEIFYSDNDAITWLGKH